MKTSFLNIFQKGFPTFNLARRQKRNISFNGYTRIKDTCIYNHWIFKSSFESQNDGRIKTRTNHSGGIQGGISNGQDIYFNVAFKPVATIMDDQESINEAGESVTVSGKGRHDPCVVPRAVPIVDAMAALVIADYLLISKTNRL